MPYLQLDVPDRYPADSKRALAKRMGDDYARIMQSDASLVSVAIRELPDGGLWSCGDGDPQPGARLMCDIRRGRSPEQRAALAQALIDACGEILNLRSDLLPVEFTQHAGDEMFRSGRGWSKDWTANEAK